MNDRPDWNHDGRDWPNREASRFVEADGLRWHVQIMGHGPAVLLLHGTGAATHSWRDLLPLLAREFTVLAPDLPGHGFTGRATPDQLSLPGMARAVGRLVSALATPPMLVVGHSAGAAVLARMSLDGLIAPAALVSLNGAIMPLRGAPGRVFSPIARLFAQTEIMPRLFAWRAGDRAMIERLLRATGSAIDPLAVTLYGRLASRPAHAGAALGMMARWDLWSLERDLPRLRTPLTLVVGSNDRTIPPADALRVRALLPRAEVISLPGLGHLAHEERPDLVADIILRVARTQLVLAAA